MMRGIPNWASGGKSCGRGAVGGKVVEGTVVEGWRFGGGQYARVCLCVREGVNPIPNLLWLSVCVCVCVCVYSKLYTEITKIGLVYIYI